MCYPVRSQLNRRRPLTPNEGGATLLQEWLNACLAACAKPAILYSGCRKILRPYRLEFTGLDQSLQLKHCGYTTNKLRMLEKNYLHHESRQVAIALWEKRRGQERYGSVGFTTYAHFVKGGSIDAKRSKRASVFGPCIQSVTITLLTKRTYTIDVFYRTTELLKKFPADLVFLRDVLLEPFDFTGLECRGVICHFANVTVHPMYWVTIAPLLEEPVVHLMEISDRYFRDWIVKWSGRYLCKEYARGIQKFSQALRVKKDVMSRLEPSDLKKLQVYIRKNHPGYRNDKEQDDDDEI